LACISGGVLWALLPLEIHISRFLSGLGVLTVETVWRLFPSSVLLLAVGLVGLHIRQAGRHGWLGRAGFYVALVGLALILVGDVGLYWLHVDRLWVMTAPAYRTFRVGLWVLGLGSMFIAVAILRARVAPTWGPPTLVIGSLGGLAAFSTDLGYVGAALWMLFGASWAWQGFASLLESSVSLWRTRGPPRHKGVDGDGV